MITFGIIVDLKAEKGLDFALNAINEFKNPDFTKLIALTRRERKRFVVAAGGIDRDGLIGVSLDDFEDLKQTFLYANARMKSAGVQSTVWIAYPQACAEIIQ